MTDKKRIYNGPYQRDFNRHTAFPLGGIGAGMMCLEGTGALNHVSLHHCPQLYNEPGFFSVITTKSNKNVTRVLEGPVQDWKIFGPGVNGGNGLGEKTYGLPRFRSTELDVRFPFAKITFKDNDVPLESTLTGWSPFIPGNGDESSLPVAALEYSFTNSSPAEIEAVYACHSFNFMKLADKGHQVLSTQNGFVLHQAGTQKNPEYEGSFTVCINDPAVKINYAWFRGGWYDPLTMIWNEAIKGGHSERAPLGEQSPSPGASMYLPFSLAPGETKTIKLLFSWYVPHSNLLHTMPGDSLDSCCDTEQCKPSDPLYYTPWYAARFKNINEISEYWNDNYDRLRQTSDLFCACFYDSTSPPEVIEAIAANFCILKSPTLLRQDDGRIWTFEGCKDTVGCCTGSCTHVLNYSQALAHLFPDLERGLRETEFNDSQNEEGHQNIRAALPIGPTNHPFIAAADGQLGGISKMYRDWRISGDTDWMKSLWPNVKASLNYCIETWDPAHKGVVEEPHHNTYDIEFWGADGMCTSIYLIALKAAILMGDALDEDTSKFAALLEKGTKFLEGKLYNGDYFIQQIQWNELRSKSPMEVVEHTQQTTYTPEAINIMKHEGPKYQYGSGCLADGIIGAWMGAVAGIDNVINAAKVRTHLRSVHRYNLKLDLFEHGNPQRPGYALGNEGGLLLCTWPRGGTLSLPFVFSNEVWTGIEYQVASHLMMMGMVEEGLEIVRACRDRYDGKMRNPFDEYECGHWYIRALSSYSLLQGISGARYDAVDKILYLRPSIKGDFRSFLCTATGFGTVGVKYGKPFMEVKFGKIKIKKIEYIAHE